MEVVRVAAVIFLLAAPGAYGACPPGYEDINNDCLDFHPELLLTWHEAMAFCENVTDSTLASITSANTLRGVYEYVKKFGLTGSYWLGGSDLAFEGDWVWMDDTRIDRGTPFWALHQGLLGWSHEPSGGEAENCLALDENRQYYFNDASCDLMFHPVCQD